ncbi:MAG: electron transfer flavoprotein subunit alpha/FixB family protein [Desulfobacter sp.]|nr:MAG: electron transfer flavoprotein subunit alpha/FixB family protein [Desulfobacter sp.]
MAKEILIVTEIWNGDFRKISLEALSAGRHLADDTGAALTALVMGENVADKAEALAAHGADTVLVAENPGLASFRPCEFENLVTAVIKEKQPGIVIFGATRQGRELSAGVAARTKAGLAPECTGLFIEAGRLVATRPMYGGKVIATVDIEGEIQMVSIRPNVFEIKEAAGEGKIETLAVDLGEANVTLLEEKIEMATRVELTEADYIVSGGRGVGSEDFTVIENLARALGGAVGASRNAVDLGWRPQSDQVGQTGKVVSPKLYIACGISGAMQHIAGMSTSDVIVAINTDPDALIFKTSDYCIVEDLFEVVPAITAELEKG